MIQMRHPRSINLAVINEHDTWILMSVNANEALTLPVALLNPHFIQADLRQHPDFIRQKKRGSYMASKTLKDKWTKAAHWHKSLPSKQYSSAIINFKTLELTFYIWPGTMSHAYE